jgi:hypothetical protein
MMVLPQITPMPLLRIAEPFRYCPTMARGDLQDSEAKAAICESNCPSDMRLIVAVAHCAFAIYDAEPLPLSTWRHGREARSMQPQLIRRNHVKETD